ncbi:MAG: EamA family transporter, partial [Treponema sp.]|nr:EamA family transporter [Treponema sp.]
PDPTPAIFLSHLIPVAVGLPFLLVAPPTPDARSLAAVAFLGIVQIGVASLLYAYALRRLASLRVLLLAQLEPLAAPLWVFLLLGEAPSTFALLGAPLIILAVILIQGKRSHKEEERSQDAGGSIPPEAGQGTLRVPRPASPPTAGEVPRNAPRFFPLFVDISGHTVLVVGAGNIAERRIRSLLAFGCDILLIAESLKPELRKLVLENSERIAVRERAFREEDLAEGNFRLVLAATDRREVNALVARLSHARGIPVSVADRKEESGFYFPALAIRGTMVAGVCSGGNDPAATRDAAARIRKAWEDDDKNWHEGQPAGPDSGTDGGRSSP